MTPGVDSVSGPRNEDYLARSADPDIGRGETFWLGCAYVGGTAAWLPVPGWVLTVGSFVNVLDASALLTAQVQHDVAESVEVGLAWYGGVGRSSRLVVAESGTGEPFLAGLDLGSEFGLCGHTVFPQVAAFF